MIADVLLGLFIGTAVGSQCVMWLYRHHRVPVLLTLWLLLCILLVAQVLHV